MTILIIVLVLLIVILSAALYFQVKAANKHTEEQQQLLKDYQKRVDEQEKLLADYRAEDRLIESCLNRYKESAARIVDIRVPQHWPTLHALADLNYTFPLHCSPPFTSGWRGSTPAPSTNSLINS